MYDFFDVSIGLKQGEPLSLILLILFVNHIGNAFDIDNLTDDDLDILSIYLLMFADDMFVKFYRTGRMQNAVNALNDQAVKAMNGLLSLFKKVPIDIKTKLLLFDRMVSPILLYAAEV